MEAAVQCVKDGSKGLREAARLYNVPVETLRRHAIGECGSRPGPPTVLTEEEEDKLAEYLIQMSDMGFGLNRETVMEMAYKIVEKLGRNHPFKHERAGRAWFEGFQRRHPNLTLRKPQPLSYCRAASSNQATIDDFFAKLGAMYGRLNLISKPMYIYNADETGISVVHKPGKVVAQLGRSNVYSITSAERGKTHTVLTCVSASGHAIPPMMVYPRKKCVPDNLRDGAVPGTLFTNSESGWINADLCLEWFKFFLEQIPFARPILLILDGHTSHTSIELIDLARENKIHLLCLPPHTTHILQPLDVGVFKSFKANFSKACTNYLSKHPGRVITVEKLASLVAEAWPLSMSTVNILSGFRKCGIYPFNPGEVNDRQLAPSKAVCPRAVTSQPQETPVFTKEKEELFKKRYEENFDIPDPEYVVWLKLNHPDAEVSSLETSSVSSSVKASSTDSSKVLSDVLVLPEPKSSNKKRKEPSRAKCLTNDSVLEEMKAKEKEKIEKEEEKKAKALEKRQKKQQREEQKKEKAEQRKKTQKRKTHRNETVDEILSKLKLTDDDQGTENAQSESESDAVCPKCGVVYSTDRRGRWVCCDGCGVWYHVKCTSLKGKKRLPDDFFCEECN